MKNSEVKKLLKSSKKVSSFVGPAYVAMHKSVVSEIQAQKDRNAKAAQRSLHFTINACYNDSPRLQPEIQDIVDRIRNILHESGLDATGVEESQIDTLSELAISSITIEDLAEPKAEKILVRGEEAQSRKLYNIRFNMKGFVSLLFDWLLLGQVTEDETLILIVMFVQSIGKLYDLSLKHLEKIHAIILQEWYRLPKSNGTVNEDDLIKDILRKYSDSSSNLTEEKIRHAVDQLVEYHCAELNEGHLSITESLVIK
ncbi:hypothetical protein [Pseudoflavonifractor phocaeensis]|uniref:hypothetical protein n=1 Tax=Pseudoflavonifractor phocaeensis TaxID=1870988 RepID=UPI00195F1C0F|nr:hypothetical protein [Pseudoflavonifractor phocaeensis]MBM6723826.1 hypothetical protein [Pseudoflavonifractor phocaeensis]